MALKEDVEIPDPSEERTTTVLDLLEEMKKHSAIQSARYQIRGQYNERVLAGDQHIAISDSNTIGDDDWPSYVPRATRNLVKNLSLTWSSRILEDRPFAGCYPAHPGVNEENAETGNQYLEYLRQLYDFDDMCFRAAQLVQPHTVVGFKTIWDPLSGPVEGPKMVVDEASGLPVLDEEGLPVYEESGRTLGEVGWQVVSIFDYGTDGAEEIEDSNWCYFTRLVDVYEARALVAAAGRPEVTDDELGEESATDTWGVNQKGVPVYEIWYRPGFRYPKGLYAVVVGQVVVDAREYPYAHGELPLAVWKCGFRRTSPYGTSHVDDAVYIQKTINKLVSALDRQAEQVAAIKLLAHSSIIAAWAAGHGQIPVEDPTMAQYARYLEPPDRAAVLTSSLEDNVQALFAVFGLNEMLTGAESVKSGTSAKSIAYLNKLDSMKMSGAARSLTKAVVRMCRQSIRLAQQFVEEPRIAQVAGQDALSARLFVGADFSGLDVRVEPKSGHEMYRGAMSREASEMIQAGGPTPDLMHQQQTGLRDSALAEADRKVVSDQIQAAMQGAQVQPDPEVDPQMAIEEILSVLGEVAGTPGGPSVFQLFSAYRQKALEMMQQQQPQGAQQ